MAEMARPKKIPTKLLNSMEPRAYGEMGPWSEVRPDDQHTEFWSGPGFLVSNHGPTGTTEIRPGKINNQDPNYSRLVYNSAFPWEADGPEAIASALALDGSDGTLTLPAQISLAG